MIRRPTALLSLLAVLALAACGGDSAEDTYKDDFPPISRDIVALGEDVGRGIQEADKSEDSQLADDFGNYGQELGELQQRLDELEPPEDLASDQDELVSAMGETQGALEDIAGAAQQGDADAARDATQRLLRSSETLSSARRTLTQAVDEL